MSEGNGNGVKGVVTFRVVLLACLAALGALSLRVLNQLDTATNIAIDVRTSVAGLTVRVDSAEKEMSRLRDWVYRTRPTPNERPQP